MIWLLCTKKPWVLCGVPEGAESNGTNHSMPARKPRRSQVCLQDVGICPVPLSYNRRYTIFDGGTGVGCRQQTPPASVLCTTHHSHKHTQVRGVCKRCESVVCERVVCAVCVCCVLCAVCVLCVCGLTVLCVCARIVCLCVCCVCVCSLCGVCACVCVCGACVWWCGVVERTPHHSFSHTPLTPHDTHTHTHTHTTHTQYTHPGSTHTHTPRPYGHPTSTGGSGAAITMFAHKPAG